MKNTDVGTTSIGEAMHLQKRADSAEALRHIAMLVQNGQCVGFAVMHLDLQHNSENTVWCDPGVRATELIGAVALLEHGMKHSVRHEF
jgi:hypothetical protein